MSLIWLTLTGNNKQGSKSCAVVAAKPKKMELKNLVSLAAMFVTEAN